MENLNFKQNKMRTAALDWALLIGNMCALYDHKQEEIMNLKEEYEELPEIESDHETLEALLLDTLWDITNAEAELEEILAMRRQLQEEFFEEYNIDKEYWCQFKHWCTIITSVQEVGSKSKPNLFKKFYNFLWKIIWVWQANCGRCLADKSK